MKLNFGLLILAGSMTLVACGASKTSPDAGPGGGSTTKSTGAGGSSGTKTASSGTSTLPGGTTAATSGAKGGAGGTGGMSGAGGTGGTGGSSLPVVEGGPCSVEGQQSECAKDGYPAACGPCMGHWLYCQNGKWIPVHCDYFPPVDAAVDTQRAADIPPDLAAILDSRNDADSAAKVDGPNDVNTAVIDGGDGSPDSSGMLRGYLVFANEVNGFEACGSTNLAWADLTSVTILGAELLPKLGPVCVPVDGSVVNCPATIYVEVDGTIVSGGKYGHMSKYSQQLNIRRYLAASLTGPADCPFLPPVYP